MNCKIIGSGSGGNAVVLEYCILIDCGVSFRRLEPMVPDLQLVLLTHIHGDHFNHAALRRLWENRPGLRFAGGAWIKEPLEKCGIPGRSIDVLGMGIEYDYGKFQVSPVSLVHDVPNCGYRIFMNGEKAFYATDTGNLDNIQAKGYDLYLIEANYEEKQLSQRIDEKICNGEFVYEYGLEKRHLSKEQCDNFLCANMKENSTFIYLHQHEEKKVDKNSNL